MTKVTQIRLKEETIMTVQEYIEKCGISRRTAYRWIEEGRLKANKSNGVWHIDDRAVSGDIDMTQLDTETDSEISWEELIEQLRSENGYLRQELSKVNQTVADSQKTISDVEQQHENERQRSDTIIMQLSKQFEKQTFLLEEMDNRSLWKRFKVAFGFRE